jgi:hypothetical protein
MKEKDKKKNIIIVIMAFVIFILLAITIYFVFINKDESSNTTNDQDIEEEKILKVKQYTLKEENEEIRINNKKLKLKVVDSTLYINDEEIADVMFEGNIFVTDKYALIAVVGQYGYGINYAINEDGKIINVYKSIVADTSYSDFQVNNIRVEERKLFADYYHESCNYIDDDSTNCESKVEFVYDGNNIIMKDVSLQENINPLTKINLTNSNRTIKFGNKTINLRTENGKIYYNDKVVKQYEDYNDFGVYLSEKLILIYWQGEMCHATFIGAINEDGEYNEVNNSEEYSVYGLYEKNGEIMGTGYECLTDPDSETKIDIKIVNNGKNITIKK